MRALTAHLTTGHSDEDYEKLTTYLCKYGTSTDVQKLMDMVAKRPIRDKTPTEHLHALRLEFRTKPETLTPLRRIFQDSLAPHIAAILTSEKLADIDRYADRASELHVLYEPNAQTTIAKIETSEISFCNNKLLQTLKSITTQVASITTDIDTIKARSASEGTKYYPETYEANEVREQPIAPYRQPVQQYIQAQPKASSYRQSASAHFQPPAKFSPQAGTGPVWKSQSNVRGQFTRPPHQQSSNWRSQQQPQQHESGNYRPTNFYAPVNSQGLYPYHP